MDVHAEHLPSPAYTLERLPRQSVAQLEADGSKWLKSRDVDSHLDEATSAKSSTAYPPRGSPAQLTQVP